MLINNVVDGHSAPFFNLTNLSHSVERTGLIARNTITYSLFSLLYIIALGRLARY